VIRVTRGTLAVDELMDLRRQSTVGTCVRTVASAMFHVKRQLACTWRSTQAMTRGAFVVSVAPVKSAAKAPE